MTNFGRPVFTHAYSRGGAELVTVDSWPSDVAISEEFLERGMGRSMQRPAPNLVRFVVSNGEATYELLGPGPDLGTRHLQLRESWLDTRPAEHVGA